MPGDDDIGLNSSQIEYIEAWINQGACPENSIECGNGSFVCNQDLCP